MSLFTNLNKLKPVDSLALVTNFLLLVFSCSLLLLHQDLPVKVPLWYSRIWGLTRLTDPKYLWLLPLLISIILIVNNLLGKLLATKHYVVAKILVWTASFVSLVFLYSLYKILLAIV